MAIQYDASKIKMNKKNIIYCLFIIFLILISCNKDEIEIESGIFVDARDNQSYNWVKIGEQIWMAENFAYAPELLDDTINSGVWLAKLSLFLSSDTGFYDKQFIKETRGCLYSWEKAMELCPDGWHLPTDEEWMELETFLGMNSEELNQEGERGVDENVGGKLKESGTTFWDPPNMGGTNEFGFTARPSGHHNYFAHYPDPTFKFYDDYFDEVAFYWTATEENENAVIRYLRDSRYGIYRRKFMKTFGYSVRYVKNN